MAFLGKEKVWPIVPAIENPWGALEMEAALLG
jgi:hypothetical protein